MRTSRRRPLPLIPLFTAAGCCATVAIALAGELPIGGPPAFPALVFGPSDAMTCVGAPVQFQTKASPTHPAMTLEYQWQFQSGPGQWVDLENDPEPTPQSRYLIYVDETSRASTLRINHLSAADAGLYRCLITASNGTGLIALPARATALIYDVGGPGGLFGADGAADNNDFIAYLNGFFTAANWADVGRAGGHRGGDGLFDNNDLIAYIDLFFNQCFIIETPPEPPTIPFEPVPPQEP